MLDMDFFYRMTEGIRVTVRPAYAVEHSRPYAGEYVFTYHIRLENVGQRTAQLLRRHWEIHDPEAGDQMVDGEGVIGKTPVLRPGQVFEYQSFCVLNAPQGHMEGYYTFRRDDGTRFDARVPRFLLRAPVAG